MRHVVIAFLALALAACGPTPKPFEHEDQNDQAFRPKQDKVEVSIAPPTNMPTELGSRVAAALAVELQAYGVVAVVQPDEAPTTASGLMSTHDAPSGSGIEIQIEWSLSGAKKSEDPAIVKTIARSEDYAEASDRLVSRIAQQAAPQVATLLGHQVTYEARSLGQVALGLNIPPAIIGPPAPNTDGGATRTAAAAQPQPPASAAAPSSPRASTAPPAPQVRVTVAAVTGAPSDGNRQLFSGMRRALGSSKIVIADKGGADTFTVAGSVSLSPINDMSTQLTVTWVLKDPSGKEVGKIEQTNPVPIAATRGTWAGFGDIVADAAAEGVLQLLDRALNKEK
jgi:hypothetical protein